MNHRSGAIAVVLAAIIALSSSFLAAPKDSYGEQVSDVVDLAPLNPDFLQFFKSPVERGASVLVNGFLPGIVPSPIDRSHLKGMVISAETQSFPSSYDLRTTGKLTPVKNQNPYGTCWAFASYGSLESSLRPGETWDFSEDNLVNASGFDYNPAYGVYDSGGNFDMAAAYLARWSGPVNESDDPYPTPGIPSGLAVQKHVQEVLFYPGRTSSLDNNNIKTAVMTYGAVGTYIMWSSTYYDSSHYSYYYSGSSDPNHAVTIVGWNDDYPASNFKGTPPGNGAFIVRNSWGSSWGEGGYFYISYYDSKIGKDIAVFNSAEPVNNYGGVYQYDPLGWTASLGYGQETAWFANLFTASAAGSLQAVGFYTASLNSTYEVYAGSSLQSLTLYGTGSLAVSGYHTVSLNSQYPLSPGNKFAVAIKLTTPGYSYPIPLEYPISGYSSGTSASLGQSFVSTNGVNWNDVASLYSRTNVCLKAFTAPAGETPSASITPTQFSFQTIEGTDPPPQILFIQNIGGGTLNWQVSESASWLSLNPTSGSSAGEVDQVSLNVSVAGLGPSTYSALITVKESPTQQVLATIPVTLQVNPSPGGGGIRTVFPSSTSVQKGTGSGFLPSLFFDDSNYFQISSLFASPYYYIEWTADFQVPDFSKAKFLAVRFRGSNTPRSVTTYLKLYNWTTKRWDSLKSASISTTEKEILGTSMDCGKYISASGQLKVQVYGRTSYSSFTNNTDLLELTVGYE